MKPPGEPVETVEKKVCGRCGQEAEARLVQRCPWCFKDFCFSCRFPRGVADFCSRACAEAMFHGGDDEEGGEED